MGWLTVRYAVKHLMADTAKPFMGYKHFGVIITFQLRIQLFRVIPA